MIKNIKKTTSILFATLFCVFAITAQSFAAPTGTQVKLETNMGDIVIALDEEKAPITTANFISYVNDGFYDGLIFHRVINAFMIQGGGFTPDMSQKATKGTIKNEANNGLKNKEYTIAMARTNDPHSASSQFFINSKDNAFLDYTRSSGSGWGYAVFGEVIEGQEVVDAIEKVKTTKKGFYSDVPAAPIVIIKASVIPAE